LGSLVPPADELCSCELVLDPDCCTFWFCSPRCCVFCAWLDEPCCWFAWLRWPDCLFACESACGLPLPCSWPFAQPMPFASSFLSREVEPPEALPPRMPSLFFDLESEGLVFSSPLVAPADEFWSCLLVLDPACCAFWFCSPRCWVFCAWLPEPCCWFA
jgi:hypothetical protein